MSQITTAFNPSIWPIIPIQFDEDVGTAVPALNIINVIGGTSVGGVATNINTIGSGNTIEICLNNSISQPNTNALATAGMYSLGGNRFLHNYGIGNTFLGQDAGNLTLITANARGNTTIGARAGQSLVGTALNNADGNTLVGLDVGLLITDGSRNTGYGAGSLSALLTGSDNIGLGFDSCSAYTGAESNNICIGNVGVIADADTIRIGDTHTSNFQAGIYGVTPVNPYQIVVVGNDGELGSTTLVPMGWVNVTGTTQTIAVNTYYLANNAGTITFTLPASAALGDVFRIAGANSNAASRWTIAQNAGQAIVMGSSTTTGGVGGSITSTSPADAIELVCTTAGASTRWTAISSMGTIAVV